MKKITLFFIILLFLVLSSCVSSTNFQQWDNKDQIYIGKGGSFKTVDGVDIYTVGEPAKAFQIIGVLEHHMVADGQFNALFGNSIAMSALASKAKEQGGDAVIISSNNNRIVDVDTQGTTVTANKKAFLIKYILFENQNFKLNNEYAKQLIGLWRESFEFKELTVDAKTVYYPNGKYSMFGNVSSEGKSLVIVLGGDWKVEGKLLSYNIKSSNKPEWFPIGLSAVSEIISIDDKKMVYKDIGSNKQRTIYRDKGEQP